MPIPDEYTPRADAAADRGHLSEMFCSIQGEGPFAGERHVFVRTAGCSATCSWCDTVYSKVLTPRFVIHEGDAGTPSSKRPIDNPVAVARAGDEILEFCGRHHPVDAVSITGGEPLEQPAFVTALARRLHGAGHRVYLETNGVHGVELREILPFIDVIAMDIKLPSALGVEMWDAHRRFLGAIRDTDFEPGRNPDKSVFVKIVVDAASQDEELAVAVSMIAGVSPAIPLILQPESETLLSERTPRERAARMMATIERAGSAARQSLDCVRVMPQLHKILKVR